jgi:hypothetical protein
LPVPTPDGPPTQVLPPPTVEPGKPEPPPPDPPPSKLPGKESEGPVLLRGESRPAAQLLRPIPLQEDEP